MSTHKIWFHGEIQKLFIPVPLLAVTTVIFLSCMKFHSLFTWGKYFLFSNLYHLLIVSALRIKVINIK